MLHNCVVVVCLFFVGIYSAAAASTALDEYNGEDGAGLAVNCDAVKSGVAGAADSDNTAGLPAKTDPALDAAGLTAGAEADALAEAFIYFNKV